MKCYTRSGDNGKSCTIKDSFYKDNSRLQAIGEIDELNAFLGLAESFAENISVRQIIAQLQNDLFKVGAELAGANSSSVTRPIIVDCKYVEILEALIDKINDKLSCQTKFIIPTGTKAAMAINVARAVSRRAERSIVKLSKKSKVNPELLKYINRLSALLHVLYRFENSKKNIVEKNPVYYEK